MKRIGLLGGSFDPIHNAHLALGEAAKRHLALDELRWIPTGQAWQKAAEGRLAAPAEHRLAMLALALGGDVRDTIDRSEIDRSGPSYTIDTLEAAEAGAPGSAWFLVIGQDQYTRLHTWHRWRDILRLATLAVANRNGELPAPSAEVAAEPHRCVVVPLPPMAVSASEIRRRVAAGMSIADLVPAEVARYIDHHGLYRADTRS